MSLPTAFQGQQVRGTFYRAIDPRFREFALAGSRAAGRYSRPDEATLYLSSSVKGVKTAMIAHTNSRSDNLEIVEVAVDASGVADLRDKKSVESLGIDTAVAAEPWKAIVAAGGTPRSWLVRDRLLELGAHGLIDPSRKNPALWHLVLFRWNVADAPTVCLK